MIAGLFFSLERQHVDVARMEEPPFPFPWPRWEPLLVELIEHGRPHQFDANMPILPLSQHRILRERQLQALDVSDHTQDDSHRVAHHHFLAHRYSVCAPRAHMAKVPLQKQAMLDVPARKRNLLECAAPAHQIVFGGVHCTSLRLRVRTLSKSTSSTGSSLKDHGIAEDECWTMWRNLSSRPSTSRQTIPMRHKQLQDQFGKSWAQTEMWLTHTTTEQVHQHHTHLLVGQVACCVNVFGSRDPWSGQLCQLLSCAQRFEGVWHCGIRREPHIINDMKDTKDINNAEDIKDFGTTDSNKEREKRSPALVFNDPFFFLVASEAARRIQNEHEGLRPLCPRLVVEPEEAAQVLGGVGGAE